VACRRDYTNRRRIKEDANEDSFSRSRHRSNRLVTGSFSWKTDCFFCANSTLSEKKTGRSNVHTVSTLPFTKNVLDVCKNRTDKWSGEVEVRLVDCIDLVAVEAVYHKACHTKSMCLKLEAKTNGV
jgi:hypothetical protein